MKSFTINYSIWRFELQDPSLGFYLAHGIFRQRGDGQRGIHTGVGGHDRTVDDVHAVVIMHLKIFIDHTFVSSFADGRAAEDVRGGWQV